MDNRLDPPESAGSDRGGNERLDRLVETAERLRTNLAVARWIRGGLALALLLFVIITAASFINVGRQIGSEKNVTRMLDVAKVRWEARAPAFQKDVRELVERSAPVVSNAIVAQFKTDMPKLVQAAGVEGDLMASQFQEGLEERVRAKYRQLINRHLTILKDEFPEYSDERLHAQMLENLTLAVDNLVERHFVAKIEQRLKDLANNWDQFPVADRPRPDDAPLQDELLAAIAELIALRLSETGSPEVVQR